MPSPYCFAVIRSGGAKTALLLKNCHRWNPRAEFQDVATSKAICRFINREIKLIFDYSCSKSSWGLIKNALYIVSMRIWQGLCDGEGESRNAMERRKAGVCIQQRMQLM